MEEMKVDGETSHQENVEVEDDRMDVDQPGSMTTTEEEKKVDPYVPERTGTPTPHSSPQVGVARGYMSLAVWDISAGQISKLNDNADFAQQYFPPSSSF